jgi:hypothetical protein
MSVTTSVFLKRAALPTPARWAATIREAGFALVLDEDFEVDTFSGYLPCTYAGASAGFEYALQKAQPAELSEQERAAIGDRDVEIIFSTHSSTADLAAAIIAGGVLAHLADGVHWDHQAGEFTPALKSLELARSMEKDLRAEVEAERKRPAPVQRADLSTSRPVDTDLSARIVFRGGTLLTVETAEPTPRRFNLSLVTEDLPNVEQVRILGLWECAGRPPVVRRFSIKPPGFFKKAVERNFDFAGNLKLEPGQVDLKHWAGKLGQVEAATKMLLAGGPHSVPALVEVARDTRAAPATRQLAITVLGVLGRDAIAATPALSALASDPVVGRQAQGVLEKLRPL